jgi:phosphoribosyl-ATP pyrophosphohydrolase
MSAWTSCQPLWKNDLSKVIDGLKDKAPSHSKFEEKLTTYHKAAQRILEEARDVTLDWILVDTRPLAQAVHNEATELTNAVSTAMRELDMSTLAHEVAYIAELRELINKEPDSLEVLASCTCTSLVV